MAQLGGKISLALGGAKKVAQPAPVNGVKRSRAALRDDDEDEGQDAGRAQTVSHFDKAAGGAIDEAHKKRETGPMIIAPQANRDWKDSSKRRKQRHGLPVEAQHDEAQQNETIRELEDKKPAFGLVVAKRDSDDVEPVINGQDHVQAEAEVTQQQEQPPEPNGEASLQQKTDDELAMDALLGKTTKQDLVLPAMSEEQAFEQDFRTAPEMSTLDDYARVPVEQFGAALLRGMGWKDGEGIGLQRGRKVEKTKVPERRPALLGIGAKEEAAVAQEMGVWGKAAAKRGKEAVVYNPVLLRDKKTGQLFTEEELQKKRERDERERYEEEFERKEREREGKRRRDDGDGERREKDRGDGRRRDDERRRDRDRDDGRSRRRHDDSDEEYYRRKEKERRRRDKDDDYDRERSRRHDSGREKHRSRHDDRDRDRDRRR